MVLALVAILSLAAFGPQSADDYYKSGDQKFDKGDMDGAIADYTKAIALNPKHASAYFNRALAKRAKGDLDSALADATKSIELRPKDSDSYNCRGHVKMAQGDLDGAIADFTKAIELNPKHAIAYANRGYMKHSKGDLEGATTDLTKAIKLTPKDAEPYFKRGYVRYDQRSWADALADFRKGFDLAPGGKDYDKLRIWLIRARLGERDPATRELSEYLKGRKADDWPRKIMRFLIGELPEVEFLKGAESEDAKVDSEQRCEAYFYVGTHSLINGDKDKAKEYFQKCIDTGMKTFAEYRSASAELAAIEKAK